MKVFAIFVRGCIVIAFFACQTSAYGQADQKRTNPARNGAIAEGDVSGDLEGPPLRVLLIASYFVGHQMPLIAVGEELVSRGHNVSLFTTEVKGSRVVPQLVERVGMTFLSAGPESRSREVFEAEWRVLREKGLLETMYTLINQQTDHTLRMRQGIDLLSAKDWDIVLVDQAVLQFARYLSLKWTDVPVVIHLSVPAALPSTGGGNCVIFDQPRVGFVDRLLLVVLFKPLWRIVFWYPWKTIENSDPVLFEALKKDGSPFHTAGIANPLISTTTFGFEYSRALYPSIHFVGPMLSRSFPPIGTELQEWLNGKPEKKVVYISMGSAAYLTKEMGHGLIEGITAVGYSAVWSLRKSNRDILEGLELDKDRFFVSEWVSQLAVLQHQAIGVAVLHGGMNGIHEAIYYSVPVIVIPFGMDQPLVANRVHYQKLGIRLESFEVTSDRVTSSIKEVENRVYRERVEKQSKIFRFAGGARKAADILEHYADVGYEHLYPAFYRYQWSWVQYYNADVYLVLGLTALVLTVGVYKAMKCVCRKCCARFCHSKSD